MTEELQYSLTTQLAYTSPVTVWTGQYSLLLPLLSAQFFSEKVQSAIPGEICLCFIKARCGVIVKAMLCVCIEKAFIGFVVGL